MIYIDTETFSATPINHGTYRYAADCEVMLVTYAHSSWPLDMVAVWDRTVTKEMPADLNVFLGSTDILKAHNAMFDRNVMRLGDMKLEIPIPRWRCNMAQAYAHGLPGGLDALCGVFGLPETVAKKEGKKLIHLFCKPTAFSHEIERTGLTAKDHKAKVEAAKETWTGRATRLTHPKAWAKFVDYAKQDIVAMRHVEKLLPEWNYKDFELELYHLDQKINDRGIHMDVELAKAAVRAVAAEQERLKDQVQANTNGDVQSANQRDKMLYHICETYGITLPDLSKSTIERRLNDPDLPRGLRELLALRLDAATTSTAKYTALLRGVLEDNRLRGTMQFDGAARTRRWAHRQMQTGNLPRPTLKQAEIDLGIEALKLGVEDIVVPNIMELASSAIRGSITAPKGRKLVVADLANIEGRFAAWVAGEDWKLQAFRDYDTCLGTDGKWYTPDEYYSRALRHEYVEFEMEKGEPVRKGPDLYKLAYAKAFHCSPDEAVGDKRQIGKVMELFCQYGGRVGAFITGSATYGIDLTDMAGRVMPTIPRTVLEDSRGFLDWWRGKGNSTYGLSDDVFVVCNALVTMWRGGHSAIAPYWKELEDAAITAIDSPSRTIGCRKLKFRRDGSWLRVRLPSGAYLCYPSPRVDNGKISYMGMNQYTRKWSRLNTYGGKLFENVCQSGSGDMLKAPMPSIEAAGYDIVFTVHDELPTEAPDDERHNEFHLAALMSQRPEWAPDFPLSAAGFSTYRYRKG